MCNVMKTIRFNLIPRRRQWVNSDKRKTPIADMSDELLDNQGNLTERSWTPKNFPSSSTQQFQDPTFFCSSWSEVCYSPWKLSLLKTRLIIWVVKRWWFYRPRHHISPRVQMVCEDIRKGCPELLLLEQETKHVGFWSLWAKECMSWTFHL